VFGENAMTPGTAAAIALVAYFVAFHLLGSFTYRISGDAIELRWRVLGILTVSSRKLPLVLVREARTIPPIGILAGGLHILGRFPAKRAAVLVLRRRMLSYSFARVIYITPADPDRFVAEVNRLIQLREGDRTAME